MGFGPYAPDDVPKEIIDQDFNTPKVITFLVTAEVAVIAFARLVVISDHGASVGRVIMEPILEAVRSLRVGRGSFHNTISRMAPSA
jgi:hypothetical protein